MSIFRVGLIGVICCSACLCAKEGKKQGHITAVDNSWRNEIVEIDKEIDQLENQRNLYLAKATRLQNQGDRLQFENNNLIDARRAWQQAQIHREIATRIQQEIDELQVRKQKIMESNGALKKGESKAVK